MSGQDQDQRTLKPTAKRIQEFRSRGEVARSRDLTMVATLMGGALGLSLAAEPAHRELVKMLQVCIGSIASLSSVSLTSQVVRTFLWCTGPVSAGALVGYGVTTGAQLGWPPALTPPSFSIGKLFSGEAIGKIISPKAMSGRVLKSTAKVGFVSVAATLACHLEYARFIAQPTMTPAALHARMFSAIGRLAIYTGTALALLAAFDYFWQRRQMASKMKMTQTEFKREHREQEGDPMVVRHRKQRMRELSQRRLTTTVKEADFVVVNPTHYAVAIRYKTGEDGAPRVLAKGRGPIAQRIRELARQAGIPILPRPPLTRLLYKLVPEGREIPSALFQAVAELLAFVYRVRGRRSA